MQTIKLLSNVMDHRQLSHSAAAGLLKVVTDCAYALDVLDKYDYQQLTVDNTTTAAKFEATYESAKNAIEELRIKSLARQSGKQPAQIIRDLIGRG